MSDVRDFRLVMYSKLLEGIQIRIRYWCKDYEDDIHFGTVESLLEQIKKAREHNVTKDELIQRFDNVWNATMVSEKGIRSRWTKQGYSVDEDSLESARKILLAVVCAFIDGTTTADINRVEIFGTWWKTENN